MSESRPSSRRIRLDGLPSGLTLIRQLGSSPLSEVFLVADDEGRKLALKVLRASAGQDARIRERWHREAQLLEELQHPNLIRSFGALEIKGRPALMLEYIEGHSLRDKLREGPLGWEEATRIGVQVARALQLLHRNGALHRDVKPHNVLLDAKRGAVLADLGLVRRREDPTLTAPGAALGSPAYMSPEQARDPSNLGPEADVYSLGATVHHALSGIPPFLGNGVGEVIHRVLHLDPEPLPDTVPADLADVIAMAMAKDPQDRYARARDFARDLGCVLLGTRPAQVSRAKLRSRTRKIASLAAVAAVVLAAVFLWPKPAADDAGDESLVVEAPADTTVQLPVESGRPESDPAPVPPVRPEALERDEFLSWVAPYENAYRGHLAAGRLREALAEVSVLDEAVLPAGASNAFRTMRQSLVRETRIAIHARAESMSSDAEAVLERSRGGAETAIQDERFDAAEWEASVRDEWRRAGLPIDELPLRAGGADPNRYLEIASSGYARQAEQVIAARAESALGSLRNRTLGMLREGRFVAARQEWQGVKTEYLQRSATGRRERTRIAALAALEERVAQRLDELIGKPATIELRSLAINGRILPPSDSFETHRVDAGNGVTWPVSAFHLDPDFLEPFLLSDDSKDLRWREAHLFWCQGRLRRALEVMEPLQSFPFLPDEDPAFWVAEWRAEQAALAEGGRDAGTEPVPEQPAVSLTPAEQLASDWAAELPGASVQAVGDTIEIAWHEPVWGKPWSKELRWDRREWALSAWRLEWHTSSELAGGVQWRWLDALVLSQPLGALGPQIEWTGGSSAGFGLVANARQVLEWRDSQLSLDGVPLGGWVVAESARLALATEAAPEFTFDRVWLRVARRTSD